MRHALPLTLLFVLMSLPAVAQEVLCESVNAGYRECRIASSGTIEMKRELSERVCFEGLTWGTQSAGVVWVSGGCRAVFKANETAATPKPRKTILKTVACSSTDGSRVECKADTALGVAIAKKLAEADCILDESWGFDQSVIWVANGCQASFALGGFRLPADAVPASALRIKCESTDGELKECPVDTARGVGLIRQLPGQPCVLNRTWGYDGSGIWVTEGCKAEFAVAR